MHHTQACMLAPALLLIGCGDASNEGNEKPSDHSGGPTPVEVAEGCTYSWWLEHVVRCGDTYGFVYEMRDFSNAEGCPAYYAFREQAWKSVEDAALANDCSTECVWLAGTAAMFAYCGARGEVIVYRTDVDTCGTLYYFAHHLGIGWYEDFAEFEAAYPCPG